MGIHVENNKSLIHLLLENSLAVADDESLRILVHALTHDVVSLVVVRVAVHDDVWIDVCCSTLVRAVNGEGNLLCLYFNRTATAITAVNKLHVWCRKREESAEAAYLGAIIYRIYHIACANTSEESAKRLYRVKAAIECKSECGDSKIVSLITRLDIIDLYVLEFRILNLMVNLYEVRDTCYHLIYGIEAQTKLNA